MIPCAPRDGPLAPGTGFKFWIADADGFLRTSALGLNRTDRQGPGGIFGALVREANPDFKVLLAKAQTQAHHQGQNRQQQEDIGRKEGQHQSFNRIRGSTQA